MDAKQQGQQVKQCETCGKRPGKKAGYCSPCFERKRMAQWNYAEGHHYASEGRR